MDLNRDTYVSSRIADEEVAYNFKIEKKSILVHLGFSLRFGLGVRLESWVRLGLW
jgi:hypothetical protein